MQSSRSLIVVALFATVFAFAFTQTHAIQAAIPAYFYPGAAWDAFMTSSSAPKVDLIIFNPNNGPGTAVDNAYKTYIAKARSAGIKVLGYVATTWGARAISAVNRDVDLHYNMYAVDGIFFDETAVTSDKVQYYSNVVAYVKNNRAKNYVQLNPGSYYQTSAYVPLADSHMVFEDTYTRYTQLSVPSYVNSFPASKFSHVVHSCPTGSVASAVSLAKQRNVGLLFVTDDIMANPYDRLPAYWSSFLSYMSGEATTGTPTPSPAPAPTPTPTPTPSPSPSTGMKTAIPAYFYPGTTWNTFTSASSASKVEIIIFNPNNGPGTAVDANYRTYVNKAKAAGIKVLGYVATTWGARAISAVNRDVDRHYSFYGVDGIFFDETAVTSAKVQYYKDIVAYVKNYHAKNYVQLNPGAYYQTSAYVPIADSHMVWENAYSAYTSFAMPSWVRNYPASKFCHVIHSTPSTKMTNAIALAKQRNVGLVYVTDDVMANPYDRLPAYWSSFVASLR